MPNKTFDLGACYSLAWKSFAKWWIPLCLISAAILGFKFMPRLLAHKSRSRMMDNVTEVLRAAQRQDKTGVDAGMRRLRSDARAFARDLVKYTVMLMPIAFVLWSILLLFANRAVKDRKDKRSPGRVLLVAWWRVLLVAFKLFPALLYTAAIGLMCLRRDRFANLTWEQLVALSVTFLIITTLIFIISLIWLSYTYTKLYFVPLLMFEKQMGGWQACKASWRQTSGYFWWLFLTIIINFFVQGALSATIIGAVPGLSFVETVRAAAFRMTLPDEECEGGVESGALQSVEDVEGEVEGEGEGEGGASQGGGNMEGEGESGASQSG